jgi:alcohol dehydrogenase class IV
MSASALSAFPVIQLQQPKQVFFGCGSRRHAPKQLLAYGVQHLLLIASNACLGAHGSFLEELKTSFVRVEVETGIPAEPTVSDLEVLLDRYRDTPVDGVLAMGGGSVLDVAKLFCVLTKENDGTVRTLFGKDQVQSRPLPLVALPTTSGAGSEVSPNAILLDEESGLKQAVISPYLVPDIACIDPELTLTLPPALTAATGLDALCHCIEAYTNKFAHPVVDSFALEGVRLIGAHIVDAVNSGSNIDSRSALSLGSFYGGLCLGPVNTAGVHALSYPLGSMLRLPHGISNAVLLPSVFRFNACANPTRHAEIGRQLGIKDGESPEATAAAAADHLENLLTACGVPRSLASIGVQREHIPSMATAAMKVERLLRNNPRPIDQQAAETIYLQAY